LKKLGRKKKTTEKRIEGLHRQMSLWGPHGSLELPRGKKSSAPSPDKSKKREGKKPELEEKKLNLEPICGEKKKGKGMGAGT